jgi:hypothetical protein
MERWFCSIHFIPSPSITSIISLILLTFPLLNLRHAISPCAEANTDTTAPARGTSHAARGAAVSQQGLVEGSGPAASLSQPVHAPPGRRLGPVRPPSRSPAGARAQVVATPTPAATPRRGAAVTTQTIAATGVAAAVAVACGGDGDDTASPSLAMAAAMTMTQTVAVAITDRRCP